MQVSSVWFCKVTKACHRRVWLGCRSEAKVQCTESDV